MEQPPATQPSQQASTQTSGRRGAHPPKPLSTDGGKKHRWPIEKAHGAFVHAAEQVPLIVEEIVEVQPPLPTQAAAVLTEAVPVRRSVLRGVSHARRHRGRRPALLARRPVLLLGLDRNITQSEVNYKAMRGEF